jgi:hypothetical protein
LIGIPVVPWILGTKPKISTLLGYSKRTAKSNNIVKIDLLAKVHQGVTGTEYFKSDTCD